MPGMFHGVIPALLTPFDDALALLPDRLTEHATWLRETGIQHVVVCGTMGEAGALTRDERETVIATALATGFTVTVGVSAGDSSSVLANARQAAELGAHGLMCLPPTTYAATDRELQAWFAAVRDAADLPLMAYNNPEASKLDMSPQQIAALEVDAIKECSGDARRIAQIQELSDMAVLVGGDDWALEGYAAGAVGWVSGVANVLPADCLRLEALVRDGDLAGARALWPRLAPLARLDMDPRLVQSFKAALDITGRYGGPTRPPRLPLEDRSLVEAACQS